MKRLLAFLLTAVLMAGCAADVQPAGEGDKLVVCASFATMADFVGRIAGDRAQVTTMVPAGAEPHDWEPTAKDVALLEQADLLVINGAGFEHWVDGVVSTLTTERLVVVDTSQDIQLLEGGHRDHDHEEDQDSEHGHDHADGVDPHLWLDPLNAAKQLQTIHDALVEADPEGAAVYGENLNAALEQCAALDKKYQETLEALPGREIVVAHEAFGYLCARYGIGQIAAQGLTPDGEPDPARMAETISHAAKGQVKVVFFEQAASPKVAEAIAREIGAETAILNPLESLDMERGEDYFSAMEQNLEQLVRALS